MSEIIIMEIIDNGIDANKETLKTEENVCLQSVRLTINLVINVLICLTVSVCLLFAFNSGITFHNLHIVCCVLGYQFFMCHGTLIMSKYSNWAMFIQRRYRKHMHWVLQVIAAALIIAGTFFAFYQKQSHFTTLHGILGLAALVCCAISLLSGILAMHLNPFPCISSFWIKLLHYFTGIITMFVAGGSLCLGFRFDSFKQWTGNGDVFVPILWAFTGLFTLLIAVDYWFEIKNRVKNVL